MTSNSLEATIRRMNRTQEDDRRRAARAMNEKVNIGGREHQVGETIAFGDQSLVVREDMEQDLTRLGIVEAPAELAQVLDGGLLEAEAQELTQPLYQERAVLLGWLATIYARANPGQAHMMPATDAEPGFEWVLCIHVEGKQHGWHISNQDVRLFAGIPWLEDNHYDGHTTEQKLKHLEELITQRPFGI